MEDMDDYVPVEAKDFYKNARNNIFMSPEIVEECKSNNNSKSFTISTVNGGIGSDRHDDVYVAVGKDDVDVVKWALDHVVSPGAKVYLVHIYPPITYIPTPVGRLPRNQLTQDQVRLYIDEEGNRRKNLLQKYIRLCSEAEVNVETLQIEHHATAKAIVDLIPCHKITTLVMGMKKLPNSRLSRRRMAKSEFVKRSAPGFCEVSIIHDGRKYVEAEKVTGHSHSTRPSSGPSLSPQVTRHSQRNLFLCGCFSGKFCDFSYQEMV